MPRHPKTKRKSPEHGLDYPELRKWCVEQAIKWPQVLSTSGAMLGQAYIGGGVPPTYSDADVIGRAEKLLAWVGRAPQRRGL